MTKIRTHDASTPISHRKSFETHGHLIGQWEYSHLDYGMGALPPDYTTQLKEAFATHRALYVVRSYETPIAWCTATGGWTIPDVQYSITTTKHQWCAYAGAGIERPGYGQLGENYKDSSRIRVPMSTGGPGSWL